ncbi:MAG: oxidoreductase [Planctomycetota bacterium]
MKWDRDQLPELSGRVAVVTGANSGIGLETARALAGRGAHVVLACRSESKAREALASLFAEAPSGRLEFRALDLADLTSVRGFAEGLLAEHPRLDLLVDNAGVMMPATRQTTRDGFEVQLGVNHLGHFALTNLLLPALEAAPAGRVVTVASLAHRQGWIDFDDLHWERRRYRRVASYGQSKLANLLFAFELARRLQARGSRVVSTAAHPGWTATDLQRHTRLFEVLNPLFAMSPAQGALPALRAAVDPECRGGEYFGPDGAFEVRGHPVRVQATRRAQDAAAAARLWSASEELTGVRALAGT